MSTPATDLDTNRIDRFVTRLAREHKHRSHTLAAARRWVPTTVDYRIAELTCLDTEPATAAEYPAWAQTAKLFAIWHGGRQVALYGWPGNGIGRWAHQLGVNNPAGERIIERLTDATTPELLDAALTALAKTRTARPPHWATVVTELTDWADPAKRDQIRFTWAHDFYSFPPKTDATANA